LSATSDSGATLPAKLGESFRDRPLARPVSRRSQLEEIEARRHDPAVCRQSLHRRATPRQRGQDRDRKVALRDLEVLPDSDPPEVPAEILAELADADPTRFHPVGIMDVGQCSRW
jgi:hypothetical protein